MGEYHYPYAEDFRLGIAGLDADGKVDGYSDWTVSELWTNGSSSLRTTFGHGLPFVYATKTGGNATLTGAAAPTVWSNGNAAIGYTINGHDYAAFAPDGLDVDGLRQHDQLVAERRDLLLRRGAADHAEQQQRRPRSPR